MQRCLQLAVLGAGKVAPNPMVGAVLVYGDRIIGEGWHMQFGGPHAEPNCISSVAEADRPLVKESTLYVSLEPCAHFGKTPPCADLIIQHNIKKVVVGCRDPFEEVNGKGIEKLKTAGIEVTVGVLEKECIDLNKYFFTFYTRNRPYIILKWAQTADGFIGSREHHAGSRVLISGEITNRLVHKWRTQVSSILVGTNTAVKDDPSLTARLWPGDNPLRLVLDRSLRLPASAKLLDDSASTIVFNNIKETSKGNILYHKLDGHNNMVKQIIDTLFSRKINSLLVEGGAQMLQSFIDTDMWDEARIITNSRMHLQDGIRAPQLRNAEPFGKEAYGDDEIVTVMHSSK